MKFHPNCTVLRLLAFLLALCWGWGSATAASSTGKLVVYWPSMFMGFLSYSTIWVGEKEAGPLKPGKQMAIDLAPGSHIVYASGFPTITGTTTVEVQAGMTHYVRVSTELAGIHPGMAGPVATSRFHLAEVSLEGAQAEVQKDGIEPPAKATLRDAPRAERKPLGEETSGSNR